MCSSFLYFSRFFGGTFSSLLSTAANYNYVIDKITFQNCNKNLIKEIMVDIITGRRIYFVAFYIVKNKKSISFAIYVAEWLYTFLIVQGNYIVQFNKSV